MKNRKNYALTLLCLFISITVSFAQGELKTERSPLTVHPFEEKKAFHQATPQSAYPYRKIDGRLSGDKSVQNIFPSLSRLDLYDKPFSEKLKGESLNRVPVFIKTQHPIRRTPNGHIFYSKKEAREITLDHLRSLQNSLSLKDPVKELSITEVIEDKIGFTHIQLIQHLEGIPIYGGELRVHYAPNGSRIVNGLHYATPTLSSHLPNLSPEEALAIAHEDVQKREKRGNVIFGGENAQLLLPSSTAKLIIYPDPQQEGVFFLAYEIDLHPSLISHWAYMVDAHTGDVLDAYSQACSFVPELGGEGSSHVHNHTHSPTHTSAYSANPSEKQGRDVHGRNHTFQTYEAEDQEGRFNLMIDATKRMFKGIPSNEPFPGFGGETGAIMTMDLKNQALEQDVTFSYVFSDNDQWDPIAVSAHTNSSICYDYFEQVHGRNSIDGAGVDVVSFINVTNEDGSSMGNAFWVDKFMFYGNGNQNFPVPLAGALDVGGHEMSHGVIASSANLEYKNISGALNESFADVFGVLIDRDDYQLAEDVVNPDVFPSGAMRDMADPHNGVSPNPNDPRWQPKHMDEYVETTADNGGVHINSGIPNHAAYRIMESIGKDKTEQIYYRALTQYLTRSSNFLDCRFAVVQSAKDLYGDQSQEAVACAQGFAAVGIGDPVPDNDKPTDPDTKTPPLEVNPGSQFIMFTNTDPFCDCPLQRIDLEAQTMETISNTHHIQTRISIR